METLSVTQEYLLFALEKSKGKIGSLGEEKHFLVAGGIVELGSGGYIVRNEKGKLIQGKVFESGAPYLMLLYNNISSKKKSKDVIESFEDISEKFLDELVQSLCLSLVEKGCAEEVTKDGLFGKKKRCCVNLSAVDAAIAKIRDEFQREEPLSTDTAILVTMLEKSDLLGRYFSKYESKRFKKRLKEAHINNSNDLLMDVLNAYESISAAIVIASTVVSH
ncbi:MAG: GPP34 family phosphoprotein [Clostridiales bacterium]|nr:GPP34 family phosphoprotein [Clostridiales bacterium]